MSERNPPPARSIIALYIVVYLNQSRMRSRNLLKPDNTATPLLTTHISMTDLSTQVTTRNTRETGISLSVNLDGASAAWLEISVPFLGIGRIDHAFQTTSNYQPATPKPATTKSPTPKNRLGKVQINQTQYFIDVPEVAWNFHIGGYQPAQKWLKDRKNRTLTTTTSPTTRKSSSP